MEKESVRVNANIDVFPLPLSGPSSTQAYDFNGAQLEITLNGVLVGTSVANLATQAGTLRAYVSGNQSAIVYASDTFSSSIYVKVLDVSYDYCLKSGGLLSLFYTMRLSQCDNMV